MATQDIKLETPTAAKAGGDGGCCGGACCGGK